MKNIVKALVFILLLSQNTWANDLITNIPNRKTTTLNGKWHYIVDPYENGFYNYRQDAFDASPQLTGNTAAYYNNAKPKNVSERIEYDFDRSETMMVPGDWNSQKEKLFYYEGTVWYKKSFDYKKSADGRVFVYFGGANYRADVYLNGKKLGVHIGGFTPFNFEVTDILKEKDNFLIVKVDNKRYRDAVPTVNTDWWNYGGLTRDVKLVEVANTFIKDYALRLKKGTNNQLLGFIQLDGAKASQKVTVEIPEVNSKYTVKTDANGYAELKFKADKLQLWSPESPKLYKVVLTSDSESLADQIGFRTIETKGMDIMLNGKSIFLRGICSHEENGMRGGRAFSEEDAYMLLSRVKELGANFIRLAHYPHNEYVARLADEMGILLWEEVPVYWTISWENPETYKNAENQLTELITRDKNRASVIIWSMANETPISEPRNKFLRSMIKHARSLDPSRLVSAALEKHSKEGEPNTMVIGDPIVEDVDILGFNQYIGWYGGTPESCDNVKWELNYNKPAIITEFGGGALQGLHGASNEVWTEEYQENLYKHTLDMLKRIPQFRGVTPWILTDFRSPRRHLPVVQDGWNRKGLMSEKGEKKKAYYVLQNLYIDIINNGFKFK